MSKTVHIQSTSQFSSLLSSSTIVVADFHAEWCGPCKQIAPIYEQLSAQLSRPNKITFTKIDVDKQQELAQAYGVNAMPTFMVFRNARVTQTVKGADPKKLSEVVRKLANEAVAGDSGSSGLGESTTSGSWTGASLPRGYIDVTDQADIKGLEVMNNDNDFGNMRTLIDAAKPSSLSIDGTGASQKDWVESDTDEQLMLYIPFQSTLKVHSLHLTAAAPKNEDAPMRPREIRIFTNRPHILGFDEADDIDATQTVELSTKDWDSKTNTAKIELRFVKFQNVSSLVLFVVDGEGDGEKVRIDRLRIIGESGEKRDGKIEKISEDD